MQVADATTALRQLYFIVQHMLMNPSDTQEPSELYEQHYAALLSAFQNQHMLEGLGAIEALVKGSRYYEALKKIRSLFPVEQLILSGTATDVPFEAA